ncbi:MAG: AAA family ATPase, partial [Armatimonadetes bacterium]|nr:AAA family ATPase [Armatimonadota bacterium]
MSRSIMRKIQQLLDCEDEDRRATLAGELAIEIAGQPDLVHRLVLTLCEAVSAYRAERAKIEELAQSLRTGPNPCVPVIERLESNGTIQLLVSRHGELIRVGLPPEELAQIDVAALVPGARVFLSSDYSVVVGADGQPYDMGEEATVVSVDGNGRALVDFGGGTGKRWVRLGAELLWNRDQLKPGVRVLGSSRIGLVVGIAPQPDEPVAEPEQQPRVKFAGHRRLRDQLERWLIKPLRAPEQFLAGRELSMGMAGFPICILLKGPTGVGKTHAARWAAQEAGARLIEVQPADVRNSYFGASENAIRSYIEQAAEWVRAKQGRRAVVVFNEVESLLLERSRAGDSSVYSTLLAIVDSYLNSIDRLRQFYASQPI